MIYMLMAKLNPYQRMVWIKYLQLIIFILISFISILLETQSTKRAASPSTDKCEKIEYLIRDGLERPCPALVKRDGNNEIFYTNIWINYPYFSRSDGDISKIIIKSTTTT